MTAVLLVTPKYPHNVGGALRACVAYGVGTLRWSGDRVVVPKASAVLAPDARKWRLPREERIRAYQHVDWGMVSAPDARPLDDPALAGLTPVCVEVRSGAESLPFFEHPADAVYVFGPEDGSVPPGVASACHRFVSVPTHVCMNLAAAVNVVLYDRRAKLETGLRIEDVLGQHPAV